MCHVDCLAYNITQLNSSLMEHYSIPKLVLGCLFSPKIQSLESIITFANNEAGGIYAIMLSGNVDAVRSGTALNFIHDSVPIGSEYRDLEIYVCV